MLRVLACFSFLVSFPVLALSQLTAFIDKNPVLTNESFVLTITADDSVDRDSIDTSILLRDFVVGQTNVSSSTQIINGSTTRTTTWTTLLMSRIEGQYSIPAFTVDGVSSQPIQVRVVKETDSNSQPRDIFFRNELGSDSLYINQTGVLESKLYVAVQLERGRLSDPEAEGISFKQMGDDQDQVEIINGRRYRVISRKYAITPTQQGSLTLRPPMLTGTVVTAKPRGYFGSPQTKPVQVVADDLIVDVLAKPANAPDPFIPAQYITLDEHIELNNNQITVGEPVTRKITVTATGVDQSVLPSLQVAYPQNVNVYPDKPEVTTSYQGNSVITEYIDTAAIIATAPGTIELPEVKLVYWDTRFHQMAEAKLPARTITVVAGKATQPNQQLEAPPQLVLPQQSTASSGYERVVIIALAILWLITLIAWWLHVRNIKNHQPKAVIAKPEKAPNDPELASWQILQQAIKQRSASGISQSLPVWLQQIAAVRSLSQLAISPEQEQAQQAYQTILAMNYAASPTEPSAQDSTFLALAEALAVLRSKLKQSSAQADPLSLY